MPTEFKDRKGAISDSLTCCITPAVFLRDLILIHQKNPRGMTKIRYKGTRMSKAYREIRYIIRIKRITPQLTLSSSRMTT